MLEAVVYWTWCVKGPKTRRFGEWLDVIWGRPETIDRRLGMLRDKVLESNLQNFEVDPSHMSEDMGRVNKV